MAQQKHNQVVDFSNPNADKIKSASTTNNMAKQTAVEWLWDEIDSIIPYQNIKTSQLFRDALIKAKEMEKEQIVDTFQDSRILSVTNNCSSGNQYYKETYEAKEM